MTRHLRGILLTALVIVPWPPIAEAQGFEQRGFIEGQALFYPEEAANDTEKAVATALVRWEGFVGPSSWLTISSGLDATMDSHHQVEREAGFDVDGRSIQRQPFSLRRFSISVHKGPVTVDVGRQFIRWGKTDVLTPTDRFAPKDYLSNVVNADPLGVAAGRLTVGSSSDSIDLVVQPWFTPSRTPLLNQRWTVLPSAAEGIAITDRGARYPDRAQYGARWNHIGRGYEFSLSGFDGFNNVPLFDVKPAVTPAGPSVDVERFYPSLRTYGADVAVPLRWLTFKGEAAYFTAPQGDNDEYVLYVVQLERQVGEWSFVGGYAGEHVTRVRAAVIDFDPTRGFAKSFVGRAALAIDTNRSLFFETAARRAGSFVRFEYSQAAGQHWRATAGVAWIRGDQDDFLGQYHRNSHVSLSLRYSF